MPSKLLTISLKLFEYLRGDPDRKIGYVLLTTGVGLIGRSYLLLGLQLGFPENSYLTSLSVEKEFGFIDGLGLLLTFFGLGILVHSYWKANKALPTNTLFYFPGFNNMRPEKPTELLPKKFQKKSYDIHVAPFDSYDTGSLIIKLNYIQATVNERYPRDGATTSYLAVAGSIPFLYVIGTLFNNGYSKLYLADYYRSEGEWKSLNGFGEIDQLPKLLYSFNQKDESKSEILEKMSVQQGNSLNITISFTANISPLSLPKELQSSDVINVKLEQGYGYDAIQSEYGVFEIAKEIQHLMALASQKAGSIHLFICAQASFCTALGSLYQPNMLKNVHVYNYNSNTNEYEWNIHLSDSHYDLVHCKS